MNGIVESCLRYKRGGFKRHQGYHRTAPQVQEGRVQTTLTASSNCASSTRREGSNDMNSIIELRLKYKRGGSKRHRRHHRIAAQVREGRVKTALPVSSNPASSTRGEGSNDINGIIQLYLKYKRGGFKRHQRYHRIVPQMQKGKVQMTSTASSSCVSSTGKEG